MHVVFRTVFTVRSTDLIVIYISYTHPAVFSNFNKVIKGPFLWFPLSLVEMSADEAEMSTVEMSPIWNILESHGNLTIKSKFK